jgi:hypothetical protein
MIFCFSKRGLKSYLGFFCIKNIGKFYLIVLLLNIFFGCINATSNKNAPKARLAIFKKKLQKNIFLGYRLALKKKIFLRGGIEYSYEDYWNMLISGGDIFVLNDYQEKQDIFYCPINSTYPLAFRPSAYYAFYKNNYEKFFFMYMSAIDGEVSIDDDKPYCNAVFAMSCIYLQRLVEIFNKIAPSVFKSPQDAKLALSNNLNFCATNLAVLSFLAAVLYSFDEYEIKHPNTRENFLLNIIVTKYGAKELLRLLDTFIDAINFNLYVKEREIDHVADHIGKVLPVKYKKNEPTLTLKLKK